MSTKAVLPPRKKRFIANLVSGMSQAQASASVGVAARTGTRWCADPMLQHALREAQDSALSDTVRKLEAGCASACDVLLDIMIDTTCASGVRLRAADLWLSHTFRARELHDLTMRIADLEAR